MSARLSITTLGCLSMGRASTIRVSSLRVFNYRMTILFTKSTRPIFHAKKQHEQIRSYGCCGGCHTREDDPNRKKIAYIALGSNMGDRFGEIERACRMMDERGIRVLRTSSLWETAPMYVLDQDQFLNGACEVETTLEPMELLDALQDIENTMGRRKVIDKGPRNIDLDILLYDSRKIHNERLTVPHIGITEREFVLRPLSELIPDVPLDAAKPWILIRDYLNKINHNPDVSPLTPIGDSIPPIASWDQHRKTHIMAILNTTPDSFSDGGITAKTPIETLAAQMIENGASIIDIGGHSTAPGSCEVVLQSEIERVLPAVQAIRQVPGGKDVAISVDTFHSVVAEQAIKAGADIVNDVSAGLIDPEMFPVVARLGCSVILMHMRGTIRTMNDVQYLEYPDGLVTGIGSELRNRVAAAEAVGIRRWRIILDPGIGFSKKGKQNVEIITLLQELREYPGLSGLPWLLGPSRKRFIGKATGVEHAKDRVMGTAAVVAGCISGGADIVRVHDVKAMNEVVKMSDWIYRFVDQPGKEL